MRVDEGLRRTELALIDARDSATGRQAYVQGTPLSVWEVAALLHEYGGDAQASTSCRSRRGTMKNDSAFPTPSRSRSSSTTRPLALL